MPAKKKVATLESVAIHIPKPVWETLILHIMGTSPLLNNRLSVKTQKELLFPMPAVPGKKRTTLKHEPLAEFWHSPYFLEGDEAPALLGVPTTMFKGAIKGAALDIPDASKAQIGRLLKVQGEFVPIWGIPQLDMRPVKQAGMTGAPDIRTRCIIPSWCTKIGLVYMKGILNRQSVLNLVATAGILQGIGDGRNGKGNLDFGEFIVVPHDDPTWHAIKDASPRAAQIAAMNNPMRYNAETGELFDWFYDEVARRGKTEQLVIAREGIRQVPEAPGNGGQAVAV